MGFAKLPFIILLSSWLHAFSSLLFIFCSFSYFSVCFRCASR